MNTSNHQINPGNNTSALRLKHAAVPALAIVISLGLYLLLTSTLYPPIYLALFDGKRVVQLALFAALIIFTIAWTPLRLETISQLGRLSPFKRIMLILFFVIGILSSLQLVHPSYALVDVSMLYVIMMLITVTAASRELTGMIFDKWAVFLLAAMGLAVFIQELMGFIAGWVLGTEFNYLLALMHFAHPRFYNQLQTWCIPVLAALPLVFPGRRWIKIGCTALLGLQWFLVISVAARGTIVSLLIAMVFIAFWLPQQRKFWLKYQLAGLLVGMVIYSGILFLNGMLIPQSQSGEFYAHSVGRSLAHTSGRSLLWRLSVEDAVEHPLLGAGPTRYACESELMLPAHPHGFPFRILGEWGIIALLLVLILAVMIGLDFLKRLKHPNISSQADPPLKAMLSISLIAGVIHACVSGLLIMPASQVTLILIAGWNLSLLGNTQLPSKNPLSANSVLIAGMLFACANLVFAAREIPQLPDRTSYSEHYGPMMPRFWQDGRVCKYSYALSTEAR